MNSYLFFIEELRREESAVAKTERDAWAKVLDRLTPEDKALVSLHECIETRPVISEPLVQKSEHPPEVKAAFAKMRREREEAERQLPAIRAAGLEALKRLLTIAQGDSGQCRHVAAFLLGLYNGNRFKFDLTDFRCLDRKIFNDCLAVLAMDFQPAREVHTYFENGGAIWEQLAKDWKVRDYTKPEKVAK